jgi:hypothetical protein
VERVRGGAVSNRREADVSVTIAGSLMAGNGPRPIPISSPGRLVVVQHILEEAMEFYALRTLPDLETEPLEEHLLMCPECRDRFVAAMSAVEKPRQRPLRPRQPQ